MHMRDMAKECKYGTMGPNMKVIGDMIRLMEKED